MHRNVLLCDEKKLEKMEMKKMIEMVDLDRITTDPEQPRTEFDDELITSLADTIETQGIINPIEIDNNYMIVTGERRYRAAKLLGLQQVPCTIWDGDQATRIVRQAVENIQQHKLGDRDLENTMSRIWESGLYPTRQQLAKAVGLSSSRISDLLETAEFVKDNPVFVLDKSMSTRDIAATRSIKEPEQRIRILQSKADGIIKSSELESVIKIAKSSEALLGKVLVNEIPLKRAIETVETIQNIEKAGVILSEAQKQNLADNIEKETDLLDKYKAAALDKVRQVSLKPPSEHRTIKPIGRTSPVHKIIEVKDNILGKFRMYLGVCDINEKRWALKPLREIKQEIDELVEMLEEQQNRGESVE